jgi:N-methylhydantoinase A
MAYRLGVDVGGTFTDAILIDEASGEIRINKVPSTPRDPSIGFLEAAHRILGQAKVPSAEVTYVVHGTTVATNAIIEGKTARTAFITTEGFRDMLEIARQLRPPTSMYDLMFEKPRPMVPRYLCFGVPERLDAQGKVMSALNEEGVRKTVEQIRREGVESIAVCLLHSHVNSIHEKRVGEIVREVFPGVTISLSSEVAPEFREYFRASTTVINASIRPVVARYLKSIEDRLRGEGLKAELLVMQSNGGVLSFDSASEKPVFMVESGPAAGVVAAAYLGGALGYKDIISFDMGGTTAKVGMIRNGTVKVTKDYEVGVQARASGGASRGSGYPIRTPVIDLVEIGAGGGSIAWVDSGGVLRVGPHSAGADPGPVCYGKGGAEPTITDANLVLGRLNPHYFLGGEIGLDVEKARQSIQKKCADRLGLDVVTTAQGILEIANAAMVNALRLISVQRGYDPRGFVLVAFGGAGPVHANRLSAETEMPTTVIPMSPGITSAMGLLVTDLKHEYSKTMIQRVDRLDPTSVEEVYRHVEGQARSTLAREGMRPENMSFTRQVDMRYVGQSYELTVQLHNGQLDPAEIKRVLKRFHEEHDRAYGFSSPEEPTEFVNLRLTAVGNIAKPQLRELIGDRASMASAQKSTRPVFFAERGGYIPCPIYNRYLLGSGCHIEGPAVVEEMDSTTVIHPGYRAKVDRFGNLILCSSGKT